MFEARGWVRFGFDPRVLDWTSHARHAGRRAVDDPALAHWHVCGGTWFVGVDALGSDGEGRVGASAPLQGPAMDFLHGWLGTVPALDAGQVSVVWPGYPQPREGETDAAFGYRVRRDAAHLDGVKPVGPDRRRMVREPHAFLLGLPLSDTGPGAAPLVVWEGSHEVMRHALRTALSAYDPADWGNVDLTDAYSEARRDVFENCRRVAVHALPGEAYVLHRLTLHGVAPWAKDAAAGPDGRMIAYFRPPMPGGVERWLNAR